MAKSQKRKAYIWVVFILLISLRSAIPFSGSTKNEQIERLHRCSSDTCLSLAPIEQPSSPYYSWKHRFGSKYPVITKEYFRCFGCSTSPPIETSEGNRLFDCAGGHIHSLPLRESKEEIYSILIDLLNYLQEMLNKRVVITSGHRCPTHNQYIGGSDTSKHLIGAEVDFYVDGLEDQPHKVIDQIFTYYGGEPVQRYECDNTDVSTPPWYNKEIFVKLYQIDEGRNGDNAHNLPYIAIQVRHDQLRNRRVVYTWKEAHRGFCRNYAHQ